MGSLLQIQIFETSSRESKCGLDKLRLHIAASAYKIPNFSQI